MNSIRSRLYERRWSIGFQTVFTVGALVAIYRLAGSREGFLRLQWDHPEALVWGAFARVAQPLLLAARFDALSRIVVGRLPFRAVLRATLVGHILNLVVPAALGTDMARYRVAKQSTHEPAAKIILALALDRACGMAALAITAGACMLPVLPVQAGAWGLPALPLALFLAVFVSRRFKPDLTRPAVVKGVFHALCLAIAAHGALILAYAFVFDAVDVDTPWLERFQVIGLALMVSGLPLSIGGHGTREGVVLFLLATAPNWFGPSSIALPASAAASVALGILYFHVATSFCLGLIGICFRNGVHANSAQPAGTGSRKW